MSTPKPLLFSIYRYQLVPISNAVQSDLFGNRFDSITDLINRKNSFFEEVVSNTATRYHGRNYGVLSRIEGYESPYLLLRLGVEKAKEIYQENFDRQTIKDHPNVFVFIDNRPDRQFVLIQKNPDAFSDSDTVKNILEDSISEYLHKYNLALYIEQTFDESEFWDTIMEYQGKITSLRFEFIRPNLANISGKAVERIKYIKSNINSHKTSMNFHAPSSGVLENLDPSNEEIDDLVSYNKEGGGAPPTIRVKGYSQVIKTTRSEKSIDLGEFHGSVQDLITLINGKLK